MTARPTTIDPLVGALAPRALESPLSAAIAYSFLATSTSLTSAALESRLLASTDVYWGSHHLIVHPFLSNISTLLDFAVLNPLVIFFLLRSRQIVVSEPLLSASNSFADRLLHWFASLSCAVLAVVLMLAYSHSFLYGKFFDAIVAISDQGNSFITVTGWIVLFWTGLFTYVVLIGALNQVSYVVHICSLRPADLFYDPLHEDGAAGLRILAAPAIEFTKASLLFLVIGFAFWIYDRLMTNATLTDRTSSIALFMAIILPLFAIPIARLHRLMCELRERLLRSVLGGEPRGLRQLSFYLDGERRDSETLKRMSEEIEAAEKLRSCVLSFPTWPLSTRTLVSYSAYFASVAAPVITKLIPLISGALGLSR
jgi:hypothetical protein